MLTQLRMNSGNLKKSASIEKGSKYIRKRAFYIIVLFLALLILFNVYIYSVDLKNVNNVNIVVLNKLCLNSIIIGILLGTLISLFSILWYEQKIKEYKYNDYVKSYARIFKADIERSRRLFKNKRFEFMKINNVTIMRNWLQSFGYISKELDYDQIQELVNYYSKIDKLIDYEKKINEHLERMQCVNLKDYPYMREYKELIAGFTFEIGNLFKVKTQNLMKKLEYLCEQ